MADSYAKEWASVNAIATDVQRLQARVDELEAQQSGILAELNSLPVQLDENGYDRNEGRRLMLQSRLETVRGLLSEAQIAMSNRQSEARTLASQFSSHARVYKEESNKASGVETDFKQLERFRFGSSVAAKAGKLANQRSVHYGDHAMALERLAEAAARAAMGINTSGGTSTISERGTFDNSISSSVKDAGNGTTTDKKLAECAMGIIGDDFGSGEVVTNADAHMARQYGMTAEDFRQYRQENHLSYVMQGETAYLVNNALIESEGWESVPESVPESAMSKKHNTPYDALWSYMTAHNYGQEDYDIYSQDPEWQRLHRAAFPERYVELENKKLEERNRIKKALNAEGVECKEVSDNIVMRSNNGNWFVSTGKNALEYMHFWNNLDSYKHAPYDEKKIQTIDSCLIEGIHCSTRDIEVLDGKFWSQHETNGTKESFLAIARCIPEVKKRISEGYTVRQIINEFDGNLSKCAKIYFDMEDVNAVTLDKCGDFYVFIGNGRHRILAAQELGYSIPVRIVGEYSKV